MLEERVICLVYSTKKKEKERTNVKIPSNLIVNSSKLDCMVLVVWGEEVKSPVPHPPSG